MNLDNLACIEEPLNGLPSDRYYATASIIWAKRVGRLATISGLIAALALVLAVAVGIVPMFFGFRSFVVVSGSMEPTISTGSIAIARP